MSIVVRLEAVRASVDVGLFADVSVAVVEPLELCLLEAISRPLSVDCVNSLRDLSITGASLSGVGNGWVFGARGCDKEFNLGDANGGIPLPGLSASPAVEGVEDWSIVEPRWRIKGLLAGTPPFWLMPRTSFRKRLPSSRA